MSKGSKRGKLGLERPRAVGSVSGWWFSWQVRPEALVPNGGKAFRKSAYRRPTSRVKRAQKVKRLHEAVHGSWCAGAPEIDHSSHFLNKREFLTVDHIVPLAKGGTWERSNLRVICNKANLRLNGKMMNGKTVTNE